MAPGGVTPTAFSRVAGEETATGSGFVKYCPEIAIRANHFCSYSNIFWINLIWIVVQMIALQVLINVRNF